MEPHLPSDCDCLQLRFTAEVIEVVERRGEECKDTVLLQWPLEQINLLGVYSNIDNPEVSLHIYLLKAKAALGECKSVYDAILCQWEFLDGMLGGREEGQTNPIKIWKLSPCSSSSSAFWRCNALLFWVVFLHMEESIYIVFRIFHIFFFPKGDWLFVCIGLLNIASR